MTKNSIEPAPARPPCVLVLLATFNGARWLEEQLDSIIGQQGAQVAILAADDGSSDGTVALVERCAATWLAAPVLAPRGHQLGAAGNFLRLLREAPLTGFDFVALADQDDVWLPGRLARAVQYLADRGADGYLQVSDVLTHAVTHATYHRGQVATKMREGGLEPVNSDFITYCRETSGQVQPQL